MISSFGIRNAVGLVVLAAPTLAHAGGTFTVITEQSGVGALRDSQPDDWWVSGLHLIDLDGDGHLDLFLSGHGGGSLAALNDGTGVFTAAPGTIPPTELLLAADVNEDGMVDISATYVDGGAQWWLNTSTPGMLGFEATEITREGNTGRAQVLADVDADGDVDWLRGHFYGMSIDLGDGTGAFETDSQVQMFGEEWPSLLPADLDADGDPDLVWVTGGYDYPPGATRILRNDGGLAFAEITELAGIPADNSVVSGVVDVDQDGDVDLITHTDLTFPHRVWLNDGDAHFEELVGAVSGDSGGSEYASWGLATAVDLDHDGLVELVVDGKHYLKILRGTGGGQFAYANDDWGIADIAESSVDGGFAFGDIDDDGDLDLVAYEEIYPVRQLVVYRNDLAVGNWVRVRAVGLAGRKVAPTAKISVHPAGQDSLIGHAQLSIYDKQAQQPYYAHHESERHFGIGSHDNVDVSVHFYPSFKLVTVEDVPAGSLVRIGEDGRGVIVPPGGGTGDGTSGSDGADESSGDTQATSAASAASDGASSGGVGLTSGGLADDSTGAAGSHDANADGCGCTSDRKPAAIAVLVVVALLRRRRTHHFER